MAKVLAALIGGVLGGLVGYAIDRGVRRAFGTVRDARADRKATA